MRVDALIKAGHNLSPDNADLEADADDTDGEYGLVFTKCILTLTHATPVQISSVQSLIAL